MNKEKLVLAYSGGLDTSVLVHWLNQQGYEVIALCLDLGQKVEDLDVILEKGEKAGASKVLIENVEEEFVQDYVFPSIQWNALYEGTYLLGTSLARPLISKKQIEVAEQEGAVAVSHGATGKGNDQVRFELSYYALNPNIRVVAPWKIPEFYQKYPGRTELLAYAEKYGIPVKASKDSGFGRVIFRVFAASTMAFPKGCSDPVSAAAAKRRTSDSVQPFQVLISLRTGLPKVRVPVLSNISVSRR